MYLFDPEIKDFTSGKDNRGIMALCQYTSIDDDDDDDVHYVFQTAEAIMKLNRSGSGLRMVCDPLLKEKVSGISFVWFHN